MRDKLLLPGGEELLHCMPSSSAVTKETLRLWPPAGTARLTTPGTGVTVKTANGEEYPLEGVHVYNCAIMIQRDPEVYEDSADEFVPERWLECSGDRIPPGAWRGGWNKSRFLTSTMLPPKADVGSIWTRPKELHRPRAGNSRSNSSDCPCCEICGFCRGKNAGLGILEMLRYQFTPSQVGIGALSVDEAGEPILIGKGHYDVNEEMYPVC